MAAEVISLYSDSEGDDPGPFIDASLVAGWKRQNPNGAGASAVQAIDLGSDSGGENSSYAAAGSASNAREFDAQGVAPVTTNSPGEDSRRDGIASGSSSSSSSSSDIHEGARGREPAFGVPGAALPGGSGSSSPAQIPAGLSQAAPPAVAALASADASGDEEGGAADAGAVGQVAGANQSSNATMASTALEATRAAGATGDDAIAEGDGASPGPGPPSDLATQAVGPGEAEAPGTDITVRGGSAGGASGSPATSADVEAMIGALPPGFVRCPGCPMVYELVPNEAAARGGGGSVTTKELPKGANLSRRSAMRHNGRHRFRCPSCATCFCGSCRATPYHIGFDCEGWKLHQAKPKCMYCGDPAEEPGGGHDDGATADGKPGEKGEKGGESDLKVSPCCGRRECRVRASEGCRKKLKCGHPCRGPGVAECLPCIEPGCPSAEVDGNDFCNVCWTESLLAAPCVKLECGHFVHVSCGREQLKRGRPTARLTFGFMSCPVCRADKVLAMHPHLGKCEGIPEQLALAHQVEELAVQRLRADELPPLQRSSLEGLHAGMRRRMAGLVRHRQVDGNPANWRARGRGRAIPLQLPYPPMQMGYPPPGGRGRGAAAAGGAGGARAHPMYPMQGAALGDWQLGVGMGMRMGMDRGLPPFVPLIPPPYALNNRIGPRVAAGLGAAGVGSPAAGAGRAGSSQHQQPVSQEEYLHRKRQKLIAQADMAMKRAVAVGGRVPGAGRDARGLAAADLHAARARSPVVRERLEQNLEKGKAVLEARRRARRLGRKELDDLPLPDGFPYRSQRSRADDAAGDAGSDDAAADAGADAGADSRADSRAADAVAVDEKMEEDRQDAKKQLRWVVPLSARGSSDGTPSRKLDVSDEAGLPAVGRASVSLPRPPPSRRGVPPPAPPEMLDIDLKSHAQGGQEEEEGHIDGDDGGSEKAMNARGWGGVADLSGGSRKVASPAAGQPSEDGEVGNRHFRRTGHLDGDFKLMAMAANHPGVSEEAAKGKSDSDGGGAGGGDRESASAALKAPAAAQASNKVDGNKGLAGDWYGVFPWAPLKSTGGDKEVDSGDDIVVVDEEDFFPPSPFVKRKGALGGVAVVHSNSMRWPVASGDACVPVVEFEAKRDDGGAAASTVVDEGDDKAREKEKASRAKAVKKRSVADSGDNPGDVPEPSPKRVHFDGSGFGMGRARRVAYRPRPVEDEWLALEDEWLALDRFSAFSRRNEQEENQAAGAVANAANAAGGSGVDGLVYPLGLVGSNHRGGRRIDVSTAMAAANAVIAAGRSDVDPGIDPLVGNNHRRGARIDLAAAAMLRLQVSNAARARSRNARVAAAAAAAMSGLAHHGVSGPSSNALPGAAPKFDGMKIGKSGGEGAAAGAAAVLLPPAPEQTKEERVEMVKRALKKYSYYQCHRCRKPYFGGLVSCEPAAPPPGGGGAGAAAGPGAGAAAEAEAAERALADIKPSELLCGKCSAGSGGPSCSEHGEEFMEHKCYWCCRKVASYFCGGVMHFCDVCNLHGFAAKPKPCLGGARCLFGGKHPDKAKNGENEFVLGCGVCRPKPEEDADGVDQ